MAKAILGPQKKYGKDTILSAESQNLDEIDELKRSADRIGILYPILVDHQGKIIDGKNRFAADQNWTKIKLDHIKTEKERLIAKLVSNNVRRFIPREEKVELLDKLGEIFLKERWKIGNVAYKIAEETGMSYRWVMKYLPKRYKDQVQSERRTVAHCATKLTESTANFQFNPIPEGILQVKTYANTDFVNIVVSKILFERFLKKAEKLGISGEVFLYNLLIHAEREWERIFEKKG